MPRAGWGLGAGGVFWYAVGMVEIPKTSTTLLRDLACDVQHARWGEFVLRYRPMMERYMGARFPTLEADEIIQETLIALIRIFPQYHYSPEERGYFHHYLTGILRRKALKVLSRRAGEARRLEALAVAAEVSAEEAREEEADEEGAWQQTKMEIALQQLLGDPSIRGRTREVFVRVAINGESPEAVAEAFGMKRNAVDQVKARMVARLRRLMEALTEAEVEAVAAGGRDGQ